jgi:uncharacterized membrane protein (UPF0127 family)
MENVYFKAINLATGHVIADKVKIAQDYRSRSIGLLNRTSFSREEGLLIKPCNSIHTFFMKFPIDVLFLDKKGKVVKIRKSLVPWRLCAATKRGYMTLELMDKALDAVQVNVGDPIGIMKM